MGHGKETPRQKMIGMMYLVLTALLALNVSKEVLNAFIIVDEGLQTTNKSFQSKIDYVYNEIDKQALIKGDQVIPVQEAAKDAKKWAHEVFEHIEHLKVHLIMHIDKVDEAAADTLAKKIKDVKSSDNYDEPTHILLGSDPAQIEGSEARELKNMLDEYRANMKGLFNREGIELLDEKTVLENMGDLGIDTKDIPEEDKESDFKFWEYKKFYHTPLWSTLAILTQIQSEVLNAESIIADKLLTSIGAGDFKFDKLEAKVMANSNYIFKGSPYEAEVFVAAFDTTQNPEILVGPYEFNEDSGRYVMTGNSTSIPVEKGIGAYSINTRSPGHVEWGGLIRMKAPDGSIRTYPFEETYQVAEAGIVVSPTKMNVFYVGVDNPVSISVPGVPSDKIYPSINNGTIKPARGGGYIVKPKTPGKTAKIKVLAEVNGDRKLMGDMDFRVKTVPDPVPKIAGKAGGIIGKNLLTAPGMAVIAEMEDFDFEMKFVVTEFSISTTLKGFNVEEKVKSYSISKKQKEIINAAPKGRKIYIEGIKAVGPDGIPRTLPTMTFKLQ